MLTNEEILTLGKQTLDLEAQAILSLKDHLGEGFINTIQALYKCQGQVIVTGIGKSAIIAKKIVATFNSTGTNATFMHAADAVHGDLGMIKSEDCVMCISKSGETEELKVLIPLLKDFGNSIIALVSNKDSFLARNADFLLFAPIEKEADPNDLAPTTSSTLHLAYGDALAVSLLKMKGFGSDHFAKIHPGGSLGKQLYLRVSDLVHADSPPKVLATDNIRLTIIEMTSKRLGMTAVVNFQNEVLGIITDGDLRRMLESKNDTSSLNAGDIMSNNPKVIESNAMAVDAISIMKQDSISQLIVEKDGKYAGVIHIHDLIKEGIV